MVCMFYDEMYDVGGECCLYYWEFVCWLVDIFEE